MATKVLEFPARQKEVNKERDTAFSLKGTGGSVSEPPAIRMRSEILDDRSIIDIDVLYSAHAGAQTSVVQMLTVLASGITKLENALKASIEDDAISADSFVQQFQMLLPQLFTFRHIGESYGIVINSIHLSLANMRGKLLSTEQISTIWRVLKELRVRPFPSLEKALDHVTELEAVKLQVDPSTFSDFLAEDE